MYLSFSGTSVLTFEPPRTCLVPLRLPSSSLASIAIAKVFQTIRKLLSDDFFFPDQTWKFYLLNNNSNNVRIPVYFVTGGSAQSIRWVIFAFELFSSRHFTSFLEIKWKGGVFRWKLGRPKNRLLNNHVIEWRQKNSDAFLSKKPNNLFWLAMNNGLSLFEKLHSENKNVIISYIFHLILFIFFGIPVLLFF